MHLRVANPQDAAAFAEIYAPFVRETRVSFEEETPTAQEMERRIARLLPTYPWLTVEEGGKAVGFAYASPHRDRPGYRWAVDTTVYLAESARGRGVGRALYASLLPLLRAQRFVAAYAGIALPNPASVGLHEAVGFHSVGLYPGIGFKAGSWHDVGWWGIDLAPRTEPPNEPIPFSELDVGLVERALG